MPEYVGRPLTAAALEEEVGAARARHHARLDQLASLGREHAALQAELYRGVAKSSTVWEMVAAALGPEDVGPHLRGLLGRIPVVSQWIEDGPSVSLLEEKVELAQRRVLQLAHHLDRLAADRAVLRGELDTVQARIAIAEEDAGRAAAEILALGEDGDLGALADRESELRSFQRMSRRLQSVVHLHHEFLRLTEVLEKNVSRLHEAAVEMLETLDAELVRLVAEARAKDLARALSADLSALRGVVARVNRIATDNAVLLTENLDRLAEEVDLLEPVDDEARKAEEELSTYLRNQSVSDVIGRARQVVALREQASRGKSDA